MSGDLILAVTLGLLILGGIYNQLKRIADALERDKERKGQ